MSVNPVQRTLGKYTIMSDSVRDGSVVLFIWFSKERESRTNIKTGNVFRKGNEDPLLVPITSIALWAEEVKRNERIEEKEIQWRRLGRTGDAGLALAGLSLILDMKLKKKATRKVGLSMAFRAKERKMSGGKEEKGYEEKECLYYYDCPERGFRFLHSTCNKSCSLSAVKNNLRGLVVR